MSVLAFADYAQAAGAPPAPPPSYDEAERAPIKPAAPPPNLRSALRQVDSDLAWQLDIALRKLAVLEEAEKREPVVDPELPDTTQIFQRWIVEAIAEHFGRARAAHEQCMIAREQAIERREAALAALEAEHATRRDDLARRLKLVRQAGTV